MTKVVGIDSAKRDDDRCQFCGAIPAHYYISCPRIKAISFSEKGAIEGVEYFKNWQPVPVLDDPSKD